MKICVVGAGAIGGLLAVRLSQAGEQVTVVFYRDLPTHGYDIILLRVHSGTTYEVDETTGQRTDTGYVSLFTGEPLEYPLPQYVGLSKMRYYTDAPPLIGIRPSFVEESMRGSFDDAVVIMMGCDGLRARPIAEAFLDKGASAFVGWSKPVLASHTDAATERLLENLLLEGLTVEDAVSQTAADVGPGPFRDAELRILTDEG